MFGLKRLHKKRDRLYLRTQLLEKRAHAARKRAVNHALDKASSPGGLFVSFLLGASTQLDLTYRARKNLLNGATRDLLGLMMSQITAYLNTPNSTSAQQEEGTPAQADSTVDNPTTQPTQD